jgi:myosin heavy subunit
LLGIKNVDFFKKIITEGRVIAGKEVLWKANTLKKATDNKDALAKQLFNNLFDWLVIMMNRTIEPTEIKEPSFMERAKTIGLLDIFGFENFAHNNYEQMCINYVNEKLHKLYIAAIFEAECVELKEEGLGDMIASIQYPDLKVQDILRMMDFKQGSAKYNGIDYKEKPLPGLFTVTDDFATQVLNNRQIKWEDVAESFKKNHDKNKKCFEVDKKNKNEFTIHHSAQDVKYDMREFVERNVDKIPDEYEEAIIKEADEIVQCIY